MSWVSHVYVYNIFLEILMISGTFDCLRRSGKMIEGYVSHVYGCKSFDSTMVKKCGLMNFF
jgi:hypothetical protein